MSQTPGSFRPNELCRRRSRTGRCRARNRLGDGPRARGRAPARDDRAVSRLRRCRHGRGGARTGAAPGRLPRRVPRSPGPRGPRASVRDAWTVASGGPGRPAGSRGLALAYVLAVLVLGTSLTGVAAYGTAGALGFLDDDRSPSPAVVAPSPEPSLSPLLEPSRTPEASTGPEPSVSVEPSESAEPESSRRRLADAPSRARRTAPRPHRRHPTTHGGSSPSPSDDDHSSPKPSRTPRPSDSPNPSESHD